MSDFGDAGYRLYCGLLTSIRYMVLWLLFASAHQKSTGRPIRSFDEIPPECECLVDPSRTDALFLAARHELHSFEQPNITSRVMGNLHTDFFHSDRGVDSFLIDEKLVVNVIMFKVNSEGIVDSLASAEDPNRPDSVLLQWKNKTQRYTSLDASALQMKLTEEPYASHVTSSPPPTFAFVRDPLSHFISGVTESNFRHLRLGAYPDPESDIYKQALIDNMVTPLTVKRLIAALTTAEKLFVGEYLLELQHIYRMTYPLLKWKPFFVGHLENFTDDWTTVMRQYGLSEEHAMYKPRAMQHPTESDPLQMKYMLTSVFNRQRQQLRAVCRLLIVDYYCLKYELPRECADMLHRGMFVRYLKECRDPAATLAMKSDAQRLALQQKMLKALQTGEPFIFGNRSAARLGWGADAAEDGSEKLKRQSINSQRKKKKLERHQ